MYCKWDVMLDRGIDYGILRILWLHLPHCKNGHLTILQDTLLHESEVTDDLLESIQSQENQTQNYRSQATGEPAVHLYVQSTALQSNLVFLNQSACI